MSLLKNIRIGRVQIAIWQNEDKDKNQYETASITRSYFDNKDKKWKETNSFSMDDLFRLKHAVDKACDTILEQVQERSASQNAAPEEAAEENESSKPARKTARKKSHVEKLEEERSSKGSQERAA